MSDPPAGSVSHWLTTAALTREEHRTLLEDPDRLSETLVIEVGGR